MNFWPSTVRVTVFPAKGTLPEDKTTWNCVPAPCPNLVVLLTVKVGVLVGMMVTLFVALDAL